MGGGVFVMRKEYGWGVFIVRKEYGQKCESGTKIDPCAIIYTGASTARQTI